MAFCVRVAGRDPTGLANWSWYLTGGLPRVVRSGNFIFGVELASDLSRVLETIQIRCVVQLLSKVLVDEERLCLV